MDKPVFVDGQIRTLLAKQFGVSKTSITRYLRGQYRTFNKRIELIRAIRAAAKQWTEGKNVFVARDETGVLHAFGYEPRKEEGFWANPLDENSKCVFPEFLLPDGVNPQYEDPLSVRLSIKVKKNLKTV